MKKYSILMVLMVFSGKITAQQGFTWRPEHTQDWTNPPRVVTPGESARPPSDAIVLFDGTDLSAWQHADGSEPRWTLGNGFVTTVPGAGNIQTRRVFGSVQLHIEWRTPTDIPPQRTGQARGNSGIFLQSRYELQVLEGYNNPTYSNGMVGSIYKQTAPMVNASRRPGEWQVYDIFYFAPEFNGRGELLSPARITVIHNGVLIHHNTIIQGNTEFIGLPNYEAHGRLPLILQAHGGGPVDYRNIWIREL